MIHFNCSVHKGDQMHLFLLFDYEKRYGHEIWDDFTTRMGRLILKFPDLLYLEQVLCWRKSFDPMPYKFIHSGLLGSPYSYWGHGNEQCLNFLVNRIRIPWSKPLLICFPQLNIKTINYISISIWEGRMRFQPK